MKIWDLVGALDPKVSSSGLLLRTIPAPQSSYLDRDLGPFSMPILFLADEFQIIVAMQFDRKSSLLYIKDFVGDWSEEKLERKKLRKSKPLEDYSD